MADEMHDDCPTGARRARRALPDRANRPRLYVRAVRCLLVLLCGASSSAPLVAQSRPRVWRVAGRVLAAGLILNEIRGIALALSVGPAAIKAAWHLTQ